MAKDITIKQNVVKQGKLSVPSINPYSANVENMVSS